MTRVGIVGTGMLGNAVGLNLLKSGVPLTVYNRTKNKTDELKKNGAIVADSPKDVAQKSDLVITVVKDANAVKSVSFGLDGIILGKHSDLIVSDMSTINPSASIEIEKKFYDEGVIWLDTPVMGGPNVAINGELVMMASGDKSSFEKLEHIFQKIAHKRFFLGKTGTAHSIKLAMNLQIAMLALSLSEGIILARGASVDPKVFLEILNSTYFKTGMSENKAFKMIQDKFDPTFTLENLKKDLSTINSAAKSFGLSLPLSIKAEEIYQSALENGFGKFDYTGVLAYLKDATKTKDLHK